MAVPNNKRSLQDALGSDEGVPAEDDEARSLRAVHERTLGKGLYWHLRPVDCFSSLPSRGKFPWGVPRDIWLLIAAYLSKEDMDRISLVNHDCRCQVWRTRHRRKLCIPEGQLSEALEFGNCLYVYFADDRLTDLRARLHFSRKLSARTKANRSSGRSMIQDCHSVGFTVSRPQIHILPALLHTYSHVTCLTLKTGAKVPFIIPKSSSLRCLELALTDTPLPISDTFPALDSLCLEVTRWREPLSDLRHIIAQSSLQTLKLFVNNIEPDKSTLDLNLLTTLGLRELRVVSYQIRRPNLALPGLASLTHLELHNFTVRPAELLYYTQLLHLRVSLLSVLVDVDEVLAELLKRNTSLLSFGLSWAGDTGDPSTLPFNCLRHAPNTLTRLSCAPVIDFRLTAHLTNLQCLDLRSCESSFSLSRFTALTALQTLVLDDRPPFRTEHLSELRRLSRVLVVPGDGEAAMVAEQIHMAAPQVRCLLNPSEEEIEW